MRRVFGTALAVTAFTLISGASAQGQDADRSVAGGGISVPGWQGKVDAAAATAGQSVSNAKLAKMGNDLMVTTGPAITYWNPANTASGNYTVKATFTESNYMGLNDHPHPYGIVVAGNDLGTADQSYLYCAAYGDGRFIVRGFAPGTPRGTFQMNGRGEAHASVNKAAGRGSSVKQDIAVSVTADKVTCTINGTVVASYDKATAVGAGKLKSTDGVWGIRFAHNTEAMVAGLTMTKQ